ncbi:hypothetical protein HMPREF0017_01931 [Acinetobacter lwoffii SH145]|nr:hypothetical protein HMPREF0017_01931 [Acinetobacter lwoffii SH145]
MNGLYHRFEKRASKSHLEFVMEIISMATKKVSRDAGTGRFVTEGYAKKHPKTTVTETIKPSKSSKK